jgi:hypothetical protein
MRPDLQASFPLWPNRRRQIRARGILRHLLVIMYHVWLIMVSQLAVDKLQLDIKKSVEITVAPSPTTSTR